MWKVKLTRNRKLNELLQQHAFDAGYGWVTSGKNFTADPEWTMYIDSENKVLYSGSNPSKYAETLPHEFLELDLKHNTIKLDSLEYSCKLVDDKLVVGCQEITLDDFYKLVKFVNKNK